MKKTNRLMFVGVLFILNFSFISLELRADLTDEIEEDQTDVNSTKTPNIGSPVKIENPKLDLELKKGREKTKPKLKPKPKPKPKKVKKLTPGPDNSDEPVVFESEGLMGAKFDGLVELQKNVVVSQGDFRMDADEAKVHFSKITEDVEEIVAKGNVKIFKVDPKTGQKIRARGDTITFNEQKQTVVIVGNARFWRGKDLVRGKKIIYNLKTGWLNASKVEGVITPGEKNN